MATPACSITVTIACTGICAKEKAAELAAFFITEYRRDSL
jgi:hypothetical protein